MTIAKFQNIILDWHKKNRRDMPWRDTKDPYKILVSEIMLQQTQISRVLPKYEEFLKAFPTLESLAKTPDKKLLKVWSGLGYWRRAKYLKETAKILRARVTNQETSPRSPASMVPPKAGGGARAQSAKSRRDFEGRSFVISSPESLETLPGIGRYTARALACFASSSREAFFDTNIRRVYLHFFFPSTRSARSGQVPQKISDKEILQIAQKAVDALPRNISPREWHYALFDYGAAVLKDKKINKRSRHYHKQSKFEGSFRSFRTKAVRFLLEQPGNRASRKTLDLYLKKELQQRNAPYQSREIVASLLKEKLIKKTQRFYSL